jgi:hypothetical protein
MNNLPQDPRLPRVYDDAQYAFQLNARLYEIFRDIFNTFNLAANGHLFTTTVVTASYTATATDQLLLVNNTANCTITLPDPAVTTSKRFVVKKISNNGYTVTVTSSGTIDNETTQVITDPYTSLDFVSDGTNYWII